MAHRFIATWPLEYDTPSGRRAVGYGQEITGMDSAMLQRKLDCGQARKEYVPDGPIPSLSMTKTELAALAQEAGIDAAGTKEEILNRLREAGR